MGIKKKKKKKKRMKKASNKKVEYGQEHVEKVKEWVKGRILSKDSVNRTQYENYCENEELDPVYAESYSSIVGTWGNGTSPFGKYYFIKFGNNGHHLKHYKPKKPESKKSKDKIEEDSSSNVDEQSVDKEKSDVIVPMSS